VTIAGLVADGTGRRYGDRRHVATGCNAVVTVNRGKPAVLITMPFFSLNTAISGRGCFAMEGEKRGKWMIEISGTPNWSNPITPEDFARNSMSRLRLD